MSFVLGLFIGGAAGYFIHMYQAKLAADVAAAVAAAEAKTESVFSTVKKDL